MMCTMLCSLMTKTIELRCFLDFLTACRFDCNTNERVVIGCSGKSSCPTNQRSKSPSLISIADWLTGFSPDSPSAGHQTRQIAIRELITTEEVYMEDMIIVTEVNPSPPHFTI